MPAFAASMRIASPNGTFSSRLHEGHDVAANPASEALEEVSAIGMHVKRRRFLAVERAQPDKSLPRFLSVNVVAR